MTGGVRSEIEHVESYLAKRPPQHCSGVKAESLEGIGGTAAPIADFNLF